MALNTIQKRLKTNIVLHVYDSISSLQMSQKYQMVTLGIDNSLIHFDFCFLVFNYLLHLQIAINVSTHVN